MRRKPQSPVRAANGKFEGCTIGGTSRMFAGALFRQLPQDTPGVWAVPSKEFTAVKNRKILQKILDKTRFIVYVSYWGILHASGVSSRFQTIVEKQILGIYR